MEAKNYYYTSYPEKYEAMFKQANADIDLAFAKYARGNKSLTRSGGAYLVVLKNHEGIVQLIEIEKYLEGALNGWWIAREKSLTPDWNSDAYPTLNMLKQRLEIV